MLAKVAVESAVFSVDKPYDYLVPKDLESQVFAGQRVIVPFGGGNRKTKGFILKLLYAQERGKEKYISHAFDDSVSLSEEDMAIALWMRQRYFCTLFEAASALLPPGM